MTYKLIRSSRKTFALELGPGGLTVRVPYRATKAQIECFIREHEKWIRLHRDKLVQSMQAQNTAEKLTQEEIRDLAEKARMLIPQRVQYYAPLIGVTYGRITIRRQRSRGGSCSIKGNLNFNCLLMLTPPEVLDSVVVHELCHRKEMNHSKRFYNEVLRVFPDYKVWEKWLKENGAAVMARME